MDPRLCHIQINKTRGNGSLSITGEGLQARGMGGICRMEERQEVRQRGKSKSIARLRSKVGNSREQCESQLMETQRRQQRPLYIAHPIQSSRQPKKEPNTDARSRDAGNREELNRFNRREKKRKGLIRIRIK